MIQKQHENLNTNKCSKGKNTQNDTTTPLLFTITSTQPNNNHIPSNKKKFSIDQNETNPLIEVEHDGVKVLNEIKKPVSVIKKNITDASLQSKNESESLLSLNALNKKNSNGSLTPDYEYKKKRSSTNLEVKSYKSGFHPYNISLANISGSDGKKSIPQFLINFPNITRKSSTQNLAKNLNYSHVPPKTNIQAKFYNFLERPTGWKCFLYHFTV
ncbi:unnamed protein product [Brachionus calyciflorus]|uniref:Uncharacterized protein n=1 Tax=Brachionus calyciflorus TaxID=104777 RepID=A0A813Z9F9_9BILA|nr:unnamed protein product [Brachionus calyciflorus]